MPRLGMYRSRAAPPRVKLIRRRRAGSDKCCSDPNLNIGGITVTSVPPGGSFTYVNPSCVGAESPTGCSVLHHPGMTVWHSWNTTPGQLADVDACMERKGQWITPYCEGDQPFGTFVAQSPSVQTS